MWVLIEPYVSYSTFMTYDIDGENEIIKIDYIDSTSGEDIFYTDTFDFSEFPDGIMADVETIIPRNPIVSAERRNGVLYVVISKPINDYSSEEDRNPEWREY